MMIMTSVRMHMYYGVDTAVHGAVYTPTLVDMDTEVSDVVSGEVVSVVSVVRDAVSGLLKEAL